MNWSQVLVIILSIFLIIFLIVGITLGVMLVRLTRQIRMIATTAERAVMSVEQVVERAVKGARIAALPAMVLGKIMKAMRR